MATVPAVLGEGRTTALVVPRGWRASTQARDASPVAATSSTQASSHSGCTPACWQIISAVLRSRGEKSFADTS